MRIAIVASPAIPVPPPRYGGTELVIHYLIRGLMAAGHEPILLASGDSKVDCELIPIVREALYFPRYKKDIPAHERKQARVNAVTRRKLRDLLPRIDIIHSHGFDLLPFRNFPNLTTLHGPINFDMLRYYQKRKDLYFASISENQQAGFPELNYMGVVYNGEDPAAFPMVAEPDDYVCFLGRFDRDKNPHLAIQLAVNLGIHIKVAGKIDYQAEGYFDEEVKPYFDNPLVEYLGELGFEEKVELLSHAKCNLHPTGFREPFGLDVLEAAYCGTPTLAVARGSMPELIEEGRTGMLVEDFVEGYHQIHECFDMDRNYIATRARMLFNYTTMAEQYVRTYQRVLDAFAEKK
jgi:glycosyltransferase involved in cell wall biosynthesis